ncbi:MAG TPA: LUD domain-containing protein [Candidatus Brocadiia bacterium]|nr:LUD domain-containing protein [Candidatus Brocadiia bacterium]
MAEADRIMLFTERAKAASAEVLGPAPKSGLAEEIGRALSAGRHPRAVAHPSLLTIHPWLEFASSDCDLVRHADLGIIAARYGIARTGTCVYEPSNSAERLIALLPPTCLILLRTADIVADIGALAAAFDDRHAGVAQSLFITGPSRTGDIEHVLTLGMQGPGRLVIALWHEDT